MISKFKIQMLQYLFLSNLLMVVPLQLLLFVSYFHEPRLLLGEPKLCQEKVLTIFPCINVFFFFFSVGLCNLKFYKCSTFYFYVLKDSFVNMAPCQS